MATRAASSRYERPTHPPRTNVALRCGAYTPRMQPEPIGKPTPIHVTKYDGSYHRRWPVYYVAKRGSLYLARGRAGEPVHATPDPADDPHPAPVTWDSDVYLYDDRWYS